MKISEFVFTKITFVLIYESGYLKYFYKILVKVQKNTWLKIQIVFKYVFQTTCIEILPSPDVYVYVLQNVDSQTLLL